MPLIFVLKIKGEQIFDGMHKHVQNQTLRDSNLLELLVCSYPSQPIQPYHPLLPSRRRCLRQSLICQSPRWEIIVLGSTLSTSHTAYKASLVAQMVKNLPAMRETWFQSLGWEDPLEEGMAIHSSILAWRPPWTEKPDGLQSMGSQRVGHN